MLLCFTYGIKTSVYSFIGTRKKSNINIILIYTEVKVNQAQPLQARQCFFLPNFCGTTNGTRTMSIAYLSLQKCHQGHKTTVNFVHLFIKLLHCLGI